MNSPPVPDLRISYLVGTVVDRAGALNERKAGGCVGLAGALARGRHARSIAVGIPLFWTLTTRDSFFAEKYWTEVGDQIGARAFDAGTQRVLIRDPPDEASFLKRVAQ